MLLLAMLSQIAEDKQNVIFAMEEPETAIPPYAQKRIVHELRKLSAQSILTSHSPYVLEEFTLDETMVLNRSAAGELSRFPIVLPTSVKQKRYRQEFRTRFCEALLSRRVLIAEGATEATSLPAAARRLSELNPARYLSLEALGVSIVDAAGNRQIADLTSMYKQLGKQTFVLCDKVDVAQQKVIGQMADLLFMHDYDGFEQLILKNTTENALNRFADVLEWPPHLAARYRDPNTDIADALFDYFQWSKGNWGVAEFLAQCSEDEIPEWLRNVCSALKVTCSTPTTT
jgi:putative ATP-dependent endonuclease of the OLD family